MMLTGFSIFLSASTAFTAFVLMRLIQQSNKIKGSPEISSSLPGQLIFESLLRTASISKVFPISVLLERITLHELLEPFTLALYALSALGKFSVFGKLSSTTEAFSLKSEKTISETAMAKAQFFA